MEPIWMAYGKQSGWGYISQINKVTRVKPETTYFSGIRIGIGRPQQETIDVAVDLTTQKAIYAIRRPDKRVSAPPYVNYLTEEQKVKITSIALETEAVPTYVQGEREQNYQFVAISASGGTAFSLEYDIVTKGIEEYLYRNIEDKSMKIYPAVVIKSNDWMVSIAVDLETDKVMYVFRHPIRQGF